MLSQTVQKNTLIGMEQLTGFVERHKAGLIDFPGGALRGRVVRSRSGKTVDAFAALAIFRVAEGHQRDGCDAGFFQCLAPGRHLQVGLVSRFALRNAPGLTAVVGSGRMDQQDFKALRSFPVEKCAGGLLHVLMLTGDDKTQKPVFCKKTGFWGVGSDRQEGTTELKLWARAKPDSADPCAAAFPWAKETCGSDGGRATLRRATSPPPETSPAKGICGLRLWAKKRATPSPPTPMAAFFPLRKGRPLRVPHEGDMATAGLPSPCMHPGRVSGAKPGPHRPAFHRFNPELSPGSHGFLALTGSGLSKICAKEEMSSRKVLMPWALRGLGKIRRILHFAPIPNCLKLREGVPKF